MICELFASANFTASSIVSGPRGALVASAVLCSAPMEYVPHRAEIIRARKIVRAFLVMPSSGRSPAFAAGRIGSYAFEQTRLRRFRRPLE